MLTRRNQEEVIDQRQVEAKRVVEDGPTLDGLQSHAGPDPSGLWPVRHPPKKTIRFRTVGVKAFGTVDEHKVAKMMWRWPRYSRNKTEINNKLMTIIKITPQV